MMQKPLENVLQLDDAQEVKLGDGLIARSLLALAEVKVLFLAMSAIGIAGAIAYAMSLPRYYSASITLLPPQSTSTSGAALAQLGALGGLAGMAGGLKMPSDTYVALLGSRRLQDQIIRRFDLSKHYATPSLSDTRMALATKVNIAVDKKTEFIAVTVDDLNARMAAEMANGYADELKKLLSDMAVSEAQQRRHFWEQQVARAQQQLIQSEQAFRALQARSGFATGQILAETDVKANMELRSRLVSREVQLRAISGFATAKNSEVQRLSSEIEALKSQLRALEEGGGSSRQTSSPAGEETVRAYRAMKVNDVSLEGMIRQFEIAKLDEARDAPAVQQIDRAEIPEKAMKSVRRKTAVSGSFASIFLSLFVSLGVQRFKSDGSGGNDLVVRRVARAWFGRRQVKPDKNVNI